DLIRSIATDNAQREYYLPDLVAICRRRGATVQTVTVTNPGEILGINSRRDLATVDHMVKHEKNLALMESGVTILDPATTYIEPEVRIGADSVIHPGVTIEGGSTVGSGCEIHSGVRIVRSEL